MLMRPHTLLPSYHALVPIYELPALSCPILTMSLEVTSCCPAIFAEQRTTLGTHMKAHSSGKIWP